ncbi:MAG TPA: flagellar filament capping protein FliD [Gammaproteobacteria bacterium]|nr:flagellar filament capping protein FliD [Gammaproteobacteria bacterium]
MPITAPGIGSGLDVNSIVSQLLAVERLPLNALDRKEAVFQAKISAYGNIKGALSSFQTAVRGLSDIARFQTIKATSADTTVYTAAASSSAVPGNYAVEVTQLAQTHSLRSEGFANLTSVVGSGTLTFQYGTLGSNPFSLNPDKTAQTVTIGASQNTLSGIRDAVNAANIGVTAIIVNDGSAGTPNKLVFTSKDTGESNSLKVTVTDDDTTHTDTSGLSQLAYDPTAVVGSGKNLVQTVAAQNALLNVNGINSISKANNTVTDVIQGVTLNLLKQAPGTTVNLTVVKDTASVKANVEAFVKAYNDINKTISDLTAYNASTKQAGLLQGDPSALSIQRQVRSVLTNALQFAGGNYTLLSQIGVSFQKDGTLKLDTNKLQTAIDSNFTDIAGLFAAVGKPSDSLISFVSATADTKPGSYTVDVTTLATQGKSVGSTPPAALTITAGSNDTLSVTIDGVSATVTLAAGTYASATALAAEVQSKINGASALTTAGAGVAVTVDGANNITVSSNLYGSASTVDILGNGAANLLGTPTNTTGVNVVGNIGGLTASGSGQTLSGAGDANGLKLLISGGAVGVSRGTVNYSQGYAYQLGKLADNLLATTGPITSRTDGITKSITGIGKQRDAINRRLGDVEQRLRAQFAAMDNLVAKLKSTSDFLTRQLASQSTSTR